MQKDVSIPILHDDTVPLRLWGGVECTVNRVGNVFRSQLAETGHWARADDVDLIAGLGLEAVRYPVLWEQIAPDNPAIRDWSWHDDRLGRLHTRGQRIIAGLVHHGSGPHYTDLLDPAFASGVAEHAQAVAERYPFIEDWTPINEPVTTARFSALYGHWYPHERDERSFWLAVLNQVDATRLAMRAVRRINPRARLIQTDDLGRTYATGAMRDQAGYDNARRWMSWDLLCGMVTPGHDLWSRLKSLGFLARMEVIAADPCPPDIIGINHYLTSDRFLDHRCERYSYAHGGGSASSEYVDLEAVRVLEPGPQGLAGCIQEAWERYKLPLAITEVHNGCTREEQMRWTLAAWNIAQDAKARGVDMRAITSWALFGSSGWDTLLTSKGRYEGGAYDASGGTARPTAMVPLLQALSAGTQPRHRVLQGEGWWQRPIRLHHAAVARPAPIAERRLREMPGDAEDGAPVLIVGGNGTLGRALAAACRHRDISHVALGREALNIEDEASISAALDRYRPWLVINASGWVRVDDAEDHADACMAINAAGAIRLAQLCAARDVAAVHFSSDLVFDGKLDREYDEEDTPSPLNVYGRSKAAAEAAITAIGGRQLMIRAAAFFSPFDEYNFAVHACDALARGTRFAASADHVISPTYVPDLCNAVLDLGIDGEKGIWHLTNGEACSWADFARRLAIGVQLDPALIEDADEQSLGWRAPRPRHVPLRTGKSRLMPSLSDAIVRFARDRRWDRAEPHAVPAAEQTVP